MIYSRFHMGGLAAIAGAAMLLATTGPSGVWARIAPPLAVRRQKDDVVSHSVCIVVLAASSAFRPRTLALKVRELTRSSKSMMSFKLSLGMP